MCQIAYHASHEQFKPSELIRYAIMAEQAGFDAIHSSEHFYPWSERQGQSGFSFAWLGAAMQATTLPFGMICTPGYRHHPAIVAQAAATLAEMFPKRFWLELGSGEALNESITGQPWPEKAERNERLRECTEIIQRLLNGETVNTQKLISVENAKLYTLPEKPPLVVGAALSEETAAWLGSWADGMVMTTGSVENARKILNAFRKNGGKDKPAFFKMQISYDKTEQAAMEGAYDQWRTNVFDSKVASETSSVAEFDKLGRTVDRQQIRKHVFVSSDLESHAKQIQKYMDIGFDKIVLHNVNRSQEYFIKDFGVSVLPALRSI
ncbi:MAG: TIGR03885 family FMN-dependent LLM class oxidoreductase [Sphingobacteriales bacterium]|nr:MAG: TIGR03885 family FMN-dependent LLM class oxidoreductase [Sphingobacteriales bacterium]